MESVGGTLRIGYLVPEWPSQTHAFFHRELSALRELGDAVTVLSTRRPPESACLHDFAATERAATHYLFPPSANAFALLARRPDRVVAAMRYVASLREATPRNKAKLVALLPSAAELADVVESRGLHHVHAHSCADSAHLVAMAALLSEFRYSLTLHGDLPVYGVDHESKMARAAFVTAVTRPLREQILAATSLDADRVPIITMGVDTRRFTPSERAFVRGRLVLATVARLNEMKGHAFALEAIARARISGLDVRYEIAGDGPHRAAIAARVAELGLSDEVRLLGTLGEDEVARLLARVDAFVLPSVGLGEAAPVSVMEAMAAGLPVICSRIGGTPDMITDRVDGILVAQRDVDGLAAAISELATDGSLRRRLGDAARARAVRAFDDRRLAREFHEEIARRQREAPSARE